MEDSKGYSDDDESSQHLKRGTSNNFMHQVHQQRRHSFSKQSDQSDEHNINDYNDYQYDDDEYDDIDEHKMMTSHQPSIHDIHSIGNNMNLMKKQTTDNLMEPRTKKLQRRHSADKILAKPSSKNTNSVDYLNRMVISLRSKIATYREDLRIAGEMGQKLYSQNAKKDIEIQEYENSIKLLKQMNSELSMTKDQLIQTTQLDAEHRKTLETDLHRQMSSHTDQTNQYQQQCIRLRERLEHTQSDVRHLTQLTDNQRIEIETLETRNEQIGQNAQETIDDLSQELAAEKDSHSKLKEKYQRVRDNATNLKISFEKRGTEINNLKKETHSKDLQILQLQSSNNNTKKKRK